MAVTHHIQADRVRIAVVAEFIAHSASSVLKARILAFSVTITFQGDNWPEN
jgi:hypothetical protein